jgi:hypothetical protein
MPAFNYVKNPLNILLRGFFIHVHAFHQPPYKWYSDRHPVGLGFIFKEVCDIDEQNGEEGCVKKSLQLRVSLWFTALRYEAY